MTTAIEALTDAQASLIFAALVRPVGFSATVPLDGNKIMAAQSVASVIAFQPASNPVTGAQCYVRLTADGTNLPTFAGFTEHGSSAGYFNTAGVVNLVRFWYDGTSSWFAIAQALNVVPFVMQSGAIANSAPTKIDVTFDRDMNQTITPAAAAFTVASTNGGSAVTDAITAVAWVDARTLRLTKSRTTLAADVVTLTYAVPGSNPLTDATGNVAGARAAMAVTDNVAGGSSATPVRLAALSNMTETANGDGTYRYHATTNGGWNGGSGVGVSTAVVAAGAVGYVETKIAGTSGGFGMILGLQTASTATDYGSANYGVAIWNAVKVFGSGSAGFGDASAQPAGDITANGYFRIAFAADGTITLLWSPDGSTNSYTLLHTFPTKATAAMHVVGLSGTNNVLDDLVSVRGVNVA